MTGVWKAAVVLAVLALAASGAASGAGGYTGPVAGVPWTPPTLDAATVGVPYSATVTATPQGATQVEVACDTSTLTGFPPPPIALHECAHLPPGLTATTGPSLSISGTPTTEGTFPVRLIAVWTDASGADFYTLKTYDVTVSTSAASPPCKCASVDVSITRVSTAGIRVHLALECTSGSGSRCHGTALLRAPASPAGKAAWTKGGATVPLSCFSPCGHGAAFDVTLAVRGAAFTSAARRAGTRWTVVVLPSCAGQRARRHTLTLQFNARGRLDARHSHLR